MRFIHLTTPEPIITYIIDTLAHYLAAGQRVLWLVPGGSSIPVAAAVSQRLSHHPELDYAALGHLTVTLTDERYGPVGHSDSNWRLLDEAGFSLPGAVLLPVLAGADLPATVAEFAAILKNHLHAADYSLGFFGIGPDGHTAGLLPGSPALTATKFAAGYDAATLGAVPFKRVTMTAPAIKQLDEAVVYAMGEPKRPVLQGLTTDQPFTTQPAQILKTVPRLTIFNDFTGEPA